MKYSKCEYIALSPDGKQVVACNQVGGEPFWHTMEKGWLMSDAALWIDKKSLKTWLAKHEIKAIIKKVKITAEIV